VETGSLFSRQDHWITRESILLNRYAPQTAKKSSERVTIPSRKRHMSSWTGGVRTVGSDLFEVAEQFHEAYLIGITDRRFTIWLHPFWMLDPEVVMNLPPKLGVSMNIVSVHHCVGENSSVQPNRSSEASSPPSTSCGAMSARQRPRLG